LRNFCSTQNKFILTNSSFNGCYENNGIQEGFGGLMKANISE
jgi:hypothetical protein